MGMNGLHELITKLAMGMQTFNGLSLTIHIITVTSEHGRYQELPDRNKCSIKHSRWVSCVRLCGDMAIICGI